MTSPKFKTPTFRIGNGDAFPVAAVGTMLFCLESDGELFIRIGDDGNELRFNEGDKYQLGKDAEPFNRFYLINRSGADVSATIGIGDGDIQVANSVNIVGTADVSDAAAQATLSALETLLQGPDQFISVADAGLTTAASLVLGALSKRYEAFITNLDTSITIYLGDSSVDEVNKRTIAVAPGATAVLRHKADIYAVAASGTPSISIGYTRYT